MTMRESNILKKGLETWERWEELRKAKKAQSWVWYIVMDPMKLFREYEVIQKL